MLVRENWDVRDVAISTLNLPDAQALLFLPSGLSGAPGLMGLWDTAELTHKSVRVWMFCGVCLSVEVSLDLGR